MFDCRELIRTTVRPFAGGQYVPDWQARAARAVALADYYAIRLRSSPFFEWEDDGPGGPFGSLAPLRTQLRTGLPGALDATAIAYDFPCPALDGQEAALFGSLYQDVDSVEKLAMSAIAHALCHLAPSLPAALTLCGVLYDEALHLRALTALRAIPQHERPWITPRREPFWNLLTSAEDLLAFVFFQNCLSETEGCLSAADKVVQLRESGVGGPAARTAYRIMVEETNHALTGYALLRQLDGGVEAARFDRLVERYFTVEAIRDASTRKGQRQRFAVDVARTYARERDLERTQAAIRNMVASTARIGR